jgi:hypothetical protein
VVCELADDGALVPRAVGATVGAEVAEELALEVSDRC